MRDIELSNYDCPKCKSKNSLSSYSPLEVISYKTHYSCRAGCGMDFGLNRLSNGKIQIGYDKKNAKYLIERFNLEKGQVIRDEGE